MAPGAPAAGWYPEKMSSPKGYVADVGFSWAHTKAQFRKGKPFLTQPCLSCLSFSRGRMGGRPPRRNGKRTWVLRASACLLSAPFPFRVPRRKTQASNPRAPFSGGHWPLPWAPVPINQVWLSSPQKMLSAVTFILLLAGTIKSRATQRRNAVTWESHLLCPHPPLPQPGNMGQAFSHWGSEGHTHIRSRIQAPVPHRGLATCTTTSHTGTATTHRDRQHL